MTQARAVVLLFSMSILLASAVPAAAVRVDARGVPEASDAGVTADARAAEVGTGDEARPHVDFHQVRITMDERLGRPEKVINFLGGDRAFPAFTVQGAHDLIAVHLRHRERAVSIEWVAPGESGSFVYLPGVTADDVTYEDGSVFLRDFRPDGTWSRRRLRRLKMTYRPVGQNMAQMVLGGGVALTALFAHPGDPAGWLTVATSGAIAVGASCSIWLSGGWQSSIDLGPAELESVD